MVKAPTRSSSDTVFTAVNTILCVLLLLIFFFPLYNIIIRSISSPMAIWNGDVVWFPRDITLKGYYKVIETQSIWTGYRNSLIYTVGGVVLSLFLTSTSAYALSRKEFVPGKIIMRLITFTMYFSGGLIPTYLWMMKLNLIHTVAPVILLGCVSVVNLIIMRSFFQNSIPEELREAALLDGCGDIRYFASVVLPLSKAVMAVMVLYYGVAYWNSYFNAMIYLNEERLMPLQIILRQILFNVQLDSTLDDTMRMDELLLQESIKYCIIIVASLPPMLAYPLAQKYFIKGVMIGSIKG